MKQDYFFFHSVFRNNGGKSFFSDLIIRKRENLDKSGRGAAVVVG